MAIGQSNDPNFNIQNPQDNQSLVYDSATQTFINANVSSSNGSITGGANVGTGAEIFKGLSGTDMQFRSIVAGSGVTLTQNTNDITITVDQDITGAENLGTGEEIFLSVANNSIRLKSLSTTANAGIDLSSSNTEISINVDPANINALSLANSNVFLQKSDNLFSLTNTGTARTNLDVYSKSEVDANFLKIDTANNQILPSVDNQLSLGNNSKRYSDIYAVSFHGTVSVAGTAQSISNHDLGDLGDVDTGTISTNNVLSWNGSAWVPTAISTLSNNDSLLKANNLSDLTDVADARNNLGVYSQSTSDTKYFQKGSTNLPDTDNTHSLGSNSKRFSDIYAVSFHGRSTSAGTVESLSGHNLTDLDNVNTTGASNGHVLTYNGSAWISSAASSTSTLSGLTDVDVGGVANGQVLQYNSANAQWEAGSISSNSATTTFVDLTDTPTNYSGAAGYFLKVNSGGSAIEFTADPGYVSDLSSFTTDNLTEGSTNEYYTDAKADGRIASASIGDLADVDVSGISANNVLSWNGSAFVPSTVSSGGVALTDFSVTTGSASGSGSLTYDNTSGVYTYRPADLSGYQTTANAFDGAFGSLTGTPTTVSGYGITDAFDGEYSSLANAPTLFDGEFGSLANTPTTVSGYGITDAITSVALNDVTDVDTANVTDGQALVYVSANAQWEPGTVASAYGDSNVSALLNGNIDTHIIPDTDVTYDLGSASNRFRALYLSGATIDLDGTSLEKSGTGKLLWNGNDVQDYNNLSNTPDLSVYQTTANLNSDIDAHLNQSNPTAGYVLSWNGSDYAWVAQSGGSSYGDSNVATYLNSNLDTNIIPDTHTTYDLGSTTKKFKDAYIQGTVTIGSGSISSTEILNWDTAYSWGDHSTQGYLTSYTETNDLTANVTWANVPDVNITSSSVTQHQGNITITESQISDLGSYLTSVSSSDVTAHEGNITITESQISDLGSYLTSETSHADVVVDGDFTSQGIMLRGASAGSYSILTDNSSNWNTAYGWGDHSTQGYLTAVSSSDVTQHQSNLTITESQISDLGSYLTSVSLNDLTDVDTSNADAGEVLAYNGNSWVVQSAGSLATDISSNSIGQLSDVTITTPSSGQVLKYNGSAWINDTDAGGIALTDLSVGSDASASGSGGIAYNSGTGVFTFTPPDLSSYLTAVSSSDVTQHQGNLTITESQISDLGSYLTSVSSSDVTQHQGNITITESQISDLGSYLTSVSSSDVTAHEGNITITESQISDLGSYLTDITGENLTDLSDVDTVSASDDGKYLYYDHSTTSFKWTTVSGGGSSTLSGLSDVTITSASSGQVLKYDGNAWINDTESGGIALTDLSITTASAFGNGSLAYNSGTGVFTFTPPLLTSYLENITNEDLGDLQDVSVGSATDGQVLTYVSANAAWEPTTVSSGGGGSAGTEYEEFKLNYATDGTLSSTSNLSSGISSVTIDSASGGDVTITFTGYSTPPLSVMFYGYNYASNEYNMNTLGSTGTTLRKVPGGGSSGSPTAFGSFSSLSLKVREAETGAGRSFGTTTHAWIRFVMGA